MVTKRFKSSSGSNSEVDARKLIENVSAARLSREQIVRLAEKYWAERGRPDGSPEQDWLRAERELMGMAS